MGVALIVSRPLAKCQPVRNPLMTSQFSGSFAVRCRIPLTLALILVMALPAIAQVASLTSDKSDYHPGELAVLTGSGFAANEDVVLMVLHADQTPNTGENHGAWTVSADGNGAFVTSWIVCSDDCLGSTLRAIADGQTSSRHGECTFTDSVSSDFRQATNQNPTLGQNVWINGIVQQNNSTYSEGMLLPQRVILDQLPSQTTHT